MSGKLVSLILSKTVGHPTRKAILVAFAAHAHDDGTHIWPSMKTLAEEIEVSPASLFRHMPGLVTDGLIVKVGKHRGKEATTTEYKLDLECIEALPDNALGQRQKARLEAAEQDETLTATHDDSLSETQTVPLTTIEDKETREAAAGPEAPPLAPPEFIRALLETVGPGRSGPLLGKRDSALVAAEWLESGLSPAHCLAVVNKVCDRLSDDARIWTLKFFDWEVRRPLRPTSPRRPSLRRERQERPKPTTAPPSTTPRAQPPERPLRNGEPRIPAEETARRAIADGTTHYHLPFTEVGLALTAILAAANPPSPPDPD